MRASLLLAQLLRRATFAAGEKIYGFMRENRELIVIIVTLVLEKESTLIFHQQMFA